MVFPFISQHAVKSSSKIPHFEKSEALMPDYRKVLIGWSNREKTGRLDPVVFPAPPLRQSQPQSPWNSIFRKFEMSRPLHSKDFLQLYFARRLERMFKFYWRKRLAIYSGLRRPAGLRAKSACLFRRYYIITPNTGKLLRSTYCKIKLCSTAIKAK